MHQTTRRSAKREAAEAACLGRLGLKSENLGTTRKFPIFFLGVSWFLQVVLFFRIWFVQGFAYANTGAERSSTRLFLEGLESHGGLELSSPTSPTAEITK